MEEPDHAPLPMLTSTSEGLRGSENNGSGTGTSTWYKGSYPLCRRPPLCVQADMQRMERDRERQLRDKPLLDKWPRVSHADKLRLLHEGIFYRCSHLGSFKFSNTLAAMRDLQQILHSKRMTPTGRDAIWHKQVLAFLCAQISDIRFHGGKLGRLGLPIQVARQALNKNM